MINRRYININNKGIREKLNYIKTRLKEYNQATECLSDSVTFNLVVDYFISNHPSFKKENII